MYLSEANIQLIKHHDSFITFGNIDHYFLSKTHISIPKNVFHLFTLMWFCLADILCIVLFLYRVLINSPVFRVLSFSGPCIPHRQCKVCLQRVLPFIPLFKPLLFVWSTWPLLEPLLETVRHFYSLLTVLELFRPKNVGIFRRFCLILA